jgi:L-asparagine oxygenase
VPVETSSYTLEADQRRIRRGAGTPEGLRRFVKDFAAAPPRTGFALIRGLEIDELPPTPQTHSPDVLSGHSSTEYLMVVGELLGSLVGYAEEKDGALVHDVHAVRGEESRIENSGSTDFGFHTENVHHPLRPDFLGLLCLRQDHDRSGTTRLSSIREAVDSLPAGTVDVLRAPRFVSLHPTSFTRGAAGPRPESEPHPVVFGQAPDLFMRFNVHNTRGLDAAGGAALHELSAALGLVSHQVLLEPGDLVLINNHIAAHSRSAFTPRYDGRDRWLRRFYSLAKVPEWAEQIMARPHVIPPVSDVYRSQPIATPSRSL